MIYSIRLRYCLVSLLFVSVPHVVLSGELEQTIARSYEIRLIGDMQMNISNTKQHIKTETALAYTWRGNSNKRQLYYDSFWVKALNGTQTIMDVYRDASKIVVVNKGKEDEVLYKDSPEDLRAEFDDSFRSPLATIALDDNGKVIERTNIGKPGAQALVQSGAISNALIFHPPFYGNKDSWTSPNEFSVGQNKTMKGDLAYSKVRVENGLQVVKVTGTFSEENINLEGSPITLTKAMYKISGEQSYNLVKQEWVAGKMLIKVTLEMGAGGKVIGNSAGTIDITFKQLPKTP
ncbi:MAG: hypothetical protein COA78_19155 [Blastopirellula sp.]|nr:MAG: hypothetical protein COA78_19155 [Blastopirellula sp.]